MTVSKKAPCTTRWPASSRLARPAAGVTVNAFGDGAQPFWAVVDGVHRRHVGQQRLRGADVAGRLVTADVLLTRLQREPVGRRPVGIDRDADQPARQHALQTVAHRHVSRVRPTEEQRHAEALRRADGDVGAQFAGRGQHGQRQQVGGDGGQRPALACRGDQGREVSYHPAGARRLQHQAEQVSVGQPGVKVGDLDVDADRGGAAAHHGQRLRQAVGVDDDARRTGLGLVRAAHEQDGLHDGGGLVEQRRARQRQRGEVLDDLLEGQQRLEPALRDLRLVRRVGGVPGRRFEHVAPQHGRGDGVVIAEADHLHPLAIASGQRTQVASSTCCSDRAAGRFIGPAVADLLGYGGVDQLVEGCDSPSVSSICWIADAVGPMWREGKSPVEDSVAGRRVWSIEVAPVSQRPDRTGHRARDTSPLCPET